MNRLAALLLLAASPAFAADGSVTILRGSAAPPTPAQAQPQPVVIYQPILYPPALYPQYFYALPVQHHGHTGYNPAGANGWPLFRR